MGVMKQLGEMQSRMSRMQEELAQMEIDGQAGGGLVKVVLGGKGDLKKLSIDPSLMRPGEIEVLEDLVVAAAQEAKGKLEALLQEKMQDMAGGLPIPPGLKLF
jgi:hypothetical protein